MIRPCAIGFSSPLLRLTPLRLLCALLCIAALFGCSHRHDPKPGRTKLTSRLNVMPAKIVGGHFIVETKWDKHGPWNFLIDTGSSVTLVSPEFARQYSTGQVAFSAPSVRVKSAEGQATTLSSVTISQIVLLDARFENVQSLIYDCTELSTHLGVKIDGVLGFPLFRDTIMTLDYPQSRMLITPSGERPFLPGVTIPFNNTRRIPLIPVQIGQNSVLALIDSGSDGPLTLNPVGLDLHFRIDPRPGATIGTLTGNRTQELARLTDPLVFGPYIFNEPVVDLTNRLSSIGGEVLRYFTITFDQARNQVTFHRQTTVPVAPSPRRSCGLSFSKTPAYWRVAGIVPGCPADNGNVQSGDLVARINGEPVAAWDIARFDDLVRRSPEISFTFINGTQESTREIATFDLVP